MKNLKVFKILEPVSRDFLKTEAKKRGFDLEKFKDYVHPQEDYLLASDRYPIFVVADGATLELDKNGKYPSPSGAFEVARIFCEEVIKESEKIYNHFSEESIKTVFKKANKAVGEYNLANGRIKEKINFWDFDFFATTGAFAVIKNQTVYWASICDSSIMHFGKNNNLVFQPPDYRVNVHKNLPANWERIDSDKRKKIIRKVYRNGVSKNGELIGYGVITGENTTVRYLNYGILSFNEGTLLAILTDGFEEYLKLPEFIFLFRQNWKNLEFNLKEFTKTKSKENPEKFGHERAIIIISKEST
jgi:hypothetical protein